MSLTTVKTPKIASPFHLNTNTFSVAFSEAEARVIEHKAKRAGVSVSEYLRNAALGFPMG